MSLPRNTKQDVKVDIKEGDTIWDLSQKLGVDVGAASGYRSGDPNLIYPGEQLTFKDVSLDKYAQFAEDRLKSAGMNNPEHSVPDMLKENADAAKKNMDDKVRNSSQSQASNQSAADNKAKAQRSHADSKAAQLNDATKSHDGQAANADKAAKENLDAYNKAMHEQSDDLKAWSNSLPKDVGTRRGTPSESMYAFPDSDSFRQRDANNFHNFTEARKEDARRNAASKSNAEKAPKDNKTKSTQEKAPQTNADKFKSALSADNDEYRSWAQSRELDPRMFKYRYESDPQGVTKQYADDFGNYSKQYQQEHAKTKDGDARNRAASFTAPAADKSQSVSADHADTKAMAAVAGMSSASKGISQSNHQAKETAEQNLKKPIQDAADKAIHKMNEKIAKKNVFQMSADMNRGNNALSREHEGSAERSRSQHLQDAMQHMMSGMALGNDSREMSA